MGDWEQFIQFCKQKKRLPLLIVRVRIEPHYLQNPSQSERSLIMGCTKNRPTNKANVLLNVSALTKDYATMMTAMERRDPSQRARCLDTQEIDKPCLCRNSLCIGWYPCGLKYCRGRDAVGKVVSYRCGIKTCKRCLTFLHVVDAKVKCLWDM